MEILILVMFIFLYLLRISQPSKNTLGYSTIPFTFSSACSRNSINIKASSGTSKGA